MKTQLELYKEQNEKLKELVKHYQRNLKLWLFAIEKLESDIASLDKQIEEQPKDELKNELIKFMPYLNNHSSQLIGEEFEKIVDEYLKTKSK